jgi:hypothetical protein
MLQKTSLFVSSKEWTDVINARGRVAVNVQLLVYNGRYGPSPGLE